MSELKRKMKSLLLPHSEARKHIFKAKLHNFLQPESETSHLSDFAQEQEGRFSTAYQQYHKSFWYACRHSLEQAKLYGLVWPPLTPAERLWRIDFMARCILLLAYFYDSPGLRIELDHWAAEARQEKESLGEMDYLVQKSMNDVDHFCTEMKGRIDAEEPRERFWKSEASLVDGRRWLTRMSPAWLDVTSNWAEPQRDAKVEAGDGEEERGSKKIKREVWGIFAPVEA
ncbi:MAG: hypothetical protein Q9218_003746 [Villophora microphyllina]